jgi:hypothetical protein
MIVEGHDRLAATEAKPEVNMGYDPLVHKWMLEYRMMKKK